MRFTAPLCAFLLSWSTLLAAPPVDVPAEVIADVGDFATIRAKTDGTIVQFVALDKGLKVFPSDLLADKKATVVSASAPGSYRLVAYSSVGNEATLPAFITVVFRGPPAPPTPPTPTPVDPVNPPGPTPDTTPLSTFRVLLVYESGKGWTQSDFNVFYAKTVEDWLTTNTTKDGTANGWRRYDKDQRTDADTATMNALWASAKPKVTSVPVFVVERNGIAQIVPLEATPAAMVTKLQTIRGK